MEVPISEDEGILMEWAPYTNLINQIPLKILSGLFAHDLSLTCIDATNEYLALGTNVGLIFWYGRQKGDLQRLRCEVSTSAISFVKIVSTVDFMVAAGNKIGQVTVFQIPKIHPDSLPESLKPKVARQVERYTVGDLHHSEITYIEWSKNGMRLFSGDKNGLIVLTEIDFYMHLCKSSEIINETYEIVQISYYQNYLLVSSVYRCIICHKTDAKWDVNQVGKRDRKSLSNLGGVFHHNYEKPNDVNIFCARPGLRVWTSDLQGNVLQTLLFKEAISNPCSQVPLLNPALKKSVKSNKEIHFGPLFMFKDKYIVSYNDEQLYIVNPDSLVAVAVIDNVRRILSVAVNKEEIFILEGDRSLIRIAYSPEQQIENPEENLMSKSLTNPIQLAVNTIKELTSLQTQINFSDLIEQCDNIISETTIPSFNESPSVATAEECFELPVVKELPTDIDTNILDKLMHNFIGDKDGVFENPSDVDNGMAQVIQEMKNFESVTNKKNLTYELINEKEFDEDILYKSKKSKRNNVIDLDCPKNNLNNVSQKNSNIKRDSSGERSIRVNQNDIGSSIKPKSLGISSNNSINSLPDNMSPESIEKEIKVKEEILAKVLDLEPITISTVKPQSPEILYINNDISATTSQYVNNIPTKCEVQNIQSIKKKNPFTNKDFNVPKKKINPVLMDSPPKCVSIPNMWNLKEIKLEARVFGPNGRNGEFGKQLQKKGNDNDELDDWELV